MLFQLPFIFNFFWSIWKGKPVGSNPWDATTLEWTATTSPPLARQLRDGARGLSRARTSTACPGASQDFVPQNQKD